ncbi:MAG: thioredoxin domain-containing protein [Muribaculaceae bacterium]|nr:thioredoxin domain-containing protein [Muribaculaceae bacterium]
MKISHYLIAAFVALASLAASAQNTVEASPGKVIEVTQEQLSQLVGAVTAPGSWTPVNKRPAIVDFNASWCGPCRKLGVILEKAAKDYADKIDFYSVDVDHNKSIARQLGISSIPFLLFCPVGQQPQGNMGLISRDELDNIINEYLLKTAP